jgi:hypothetical protein
MWVLIFETDRGLYWEKTPVSSNSALAVMVNAFESHEHKNAITAVYLIFLEYDVSDEKMASIVSSTFSEGMCHENLWHDIDYVNTNLIGFNPDQHVFICHKCSGKLVGNHNMKSCTCISGWVRPYYRYIAISEL